MARAKRKVIRPRKNKRKGTISKRKTSVRTPEVSSLGSSKKVSKKPRKPKKSKLDSKKPKPKKGELGYVSPADRLKPFWFKKGVKHPERKGRPKGSVGLSTYLRKVIKEQTIVFDGNGRKVRKSVAQILIDTALEHAAKGRFSYFREIWERLEGKVPDHIIQETTKKLIKQETEGVALELLEIVSKVADKYMTQKLADKFLAELSTEFEKRYADPPDKEGESNG